MKKIFKCISWVLLVAIIVIQFFHPAKNIAAAPSGYHISKAYPVPEDVQQILVKTCYDCHSNTTRYPWYNNIQPVAWWLHNHIKEGKRHLNFDEFTTYRIARQYKTLDECIDEVKGGDMPLGSYTLIHKDAIITDNEKQVFFTWCNTVRDSIKSAYPADSLVMPKRKS
ncbi:heme-binding domain-containing protein [Parasediminibacterium sp. JCM 36343]|uniref:heme-binding domain-containing protein n=1 Tax=Parasediminibacterium sp. JCM 36343 TaxID=3374279 RepID=UPI00397D914F